LLDRAGDHEGGDELQRRLKAVGATRPVILDPASKRLALSLLVEWIEVESVHELPDGIYALYAPLDEERGRGEFS
jgi:hypothetical protein